MPLSKVVTELQTAGCATVRRLSTCIMYCSAHTGSNMGCEENGFQLKEKEKEGVARKTEGEKWENISSSNSFALIWIPSEMSLEVGQWDLESLWCFFSLSLPLSLILSCQWKMSNAIRRGEDDELERVSEKERAKEREQRKTGWWWFGPLAGPSPADWETQTKRESERKGKRKICICAPEAGSGWCLFILILRQQSNYTISPGNMHVRVISR